MKLNCFAIATNENVFVSSNNIYKIASALSSPYVSEFAICSKRTFDDFVYTKDRHGNIICNNDDWTCFYGGSVDPEVVQNQIDNKSIDNYVLIIANSSSRNIKYIDIYELSINSIH